MEGQHNQQEQQQQQQQPPKGKEELDEPGEGGEEEGEADPKKSKEELVELARENVKLGDDFFSRGEKAEAVDAWAEALALYKDAYGTETHLEVAPIYVKYGMTLMKLSESALEQTMNELMVQAMRDQAGGGAGKKLSQETIEEHCQEHMEDLDDAWEAIEIGRMAYEAAGDKTAACVARMALGDLCIITEDWEGADREFSECAQFRQQEYGDDRRTVDAVFMSALAKQMIPEKQAESLAQYVLARDIMARLVAKAAASNDAELTDLQGLLKDLEEKVTNFGKEEGQEGDGMEEEDEEEQGEGGGDDDGNDLVEEDDQGVDEGKRPRPDQGHGQQQEHQQNDSAAKKAKTE